MNDVFFKITEESDEISEVPSIYSEYSFEDAIEELEKLLKELESGDIPLKKAVELYNKAHQLQNVCVKQLSEAQLKVSKINFENQDSESN